MESTGADVAMKDPGPVEDRRKHRRLAIRLPVECCPKGESRERMMRAVTSNISTGGVYFEADVRDAAGRAVSAPFGEADLLELEMTIPPGEGHFPYEGRMSSVVQIVRCEELSINAAGAGSGGFGVAGRFQEPLKLVF